MATFWCEPQAFITCFAAAVSWQSTLWLCCPVLSWLCGDSPPLCTCSTSSFCRKWQIEWNILSNWMKSSFSTTSKSKSNNHSVKRFEKETETSTSLKWLFASNCSLGHFPSSYLWKPIITLFSAVFLRSQQRILIKTNKMQIIMVGDSPS